MSRSAGPAPSQDQGLETLKAVFREMTGREPDGVWRAPGRVNLIGEHTDYNDGFVLPIAIDRRTLVAAAARSDDLIRMLSLQQDAGPVEQRLGDLSPDSAKGWTAYVAGTAWALAQSAGPLSGADLVFDSNVPVGAGLSSSAALEISSGLAMAELGGIQIGLKDLALAAQKAENDYVGVPCGVMDQMVCAMAQPGHALLIDTRSLACRQVPFEPGRREAALLVIDTRVSHSLADGEYAARRKGCEQAAATLGVPALRDVLPEDLPGALARLPEPLAALVRHVVTENERVSKTVGALEAGDLAAAGSIMNASHLSLQLDYRVSSPELDLAAEAARAAGAYGARMTGGGFGGSVIALAPAGCIDFLRDEIGRAFRAHSMTEPAFFQVEAAGGCSRVWP